MPFAAPIQLDENDPNKKTQQGGVNISGQSTSFATNVPGQESGTSSKGKGSGQYTNIQSYLDANKDQANQMGQKITSNVSAEADNATSKIQDFSSKAPTVQAYDPNAAIQKATALTDDEKAQYKEQKKTGGYTGPATVDGVSGYQDVQKAASSAAQNVQNAGTETGQQQLLKQTYARPQYSAGENRLDQALLQNSAGSRASLENLSQKYAGLDKMFSDASTSVGNSINAANAQALANRNAFAGAEKSAREALINPIQARADQLNTSNKDLVSRIQSDTSDEILSEETLKALGLNEGTRLFDMNIANYLNPDLTPVGLNNAATADERQKYAALSALFDDPTMSQITADGKEIKPVSLSEQFAKDQAAKQAEFDRYAASKNVSATSDRLGEFGWNNGDMWTQATAQSLLSDYLSGKGPQTSYQYGFNMPIQGTLEPTAAQAQQRYTDLINQILNEQKYNRTIKKG